MAETESCGCSGCAGFFDSAAKNWDALESRDIAVRIEVILERIAPCPDDEVLDVGCGTGVLFPFLARRNVRRVLCLDFSCGMLEQLRRKFPQAETLCADYCRPGLFPDESFSKIIIYNAYPHFSDRRSLFASSFRYLKRGGGLYIAHSMNREALNRHHGRCPEVSGHVLEPDDAIRALYAESGFENVSVEDGIFFYACGFRPAGASAR